MHISTDWKPWLFALLAALGGLAGESAIEHFQHDRMIAHERRHVFDHLARLRARIEGVLNGNLLMVHGLSAVIASNPDLDQETFGRIASGMVTERHALRNIAGAPGLVIRLMHPLAGNEAALGLDYRTHPLQRDAAMRAVNSGQTVTAGPLELVQGGEGLVAREPVFLLPETPGGPRPLWGLVSAVIDVRKLYRLAGVDNLPRAEGLSIAIRGRDGKGADGEVFYGDPELFAGSPELISVSLPGGSWQVAARPLSGWGSHLHEREVLATRLIGLLLSALLALLTYAVTLKTKALRRTAARLEEAQKLFRGFMENLPAGAFVKDARTQQTLFENDWLQQHLPGSHHGCGMDGIDNLASLKKTPELVHRELESADGTRMHCDTLRFLLDDKGERDLVGGVVMDVSERVRAERALSVSRARLHALLNTIPDLVWLKDPRGIYLACNSRFQAFFGAGEAEILGKRDHDFIAAELADFFREHDLAAIAAGQPTMNEERVTFASDGHSELLETIKSPVFDENDVLIGVLGIARDITSRRATEDSLRATAERLQAAESVARIGNWAYWPLDRSGAWSEETYRLLGLEPGERQPDFDWLRSQIHPDDRDEFDAYLHRLTRARAGEEIPEQQFRVQRDDGKSLVVSLKVSIDSDSEGRGMRLFGTMQDVTEREAMNHDLRAQLDELTRWQSVILGREERIQELKREVNELLRAQNLKARYARPGESE